MSEVFQSVIVGYANPMWPEMARLPALGVFHLSRGQPHRAGSKAGETAPEDALRLNAWGPFRGSLWGLL